jgi:hypothetical protein
MECWIIWFSDIFVEKFSQDFSFVFGCPIPVWIYILPYFYTLVAIKGGLVWDYHLLLSFFMEFWIIWLSPFFVEKFSQNFSLLGFRLAVCIYRFPYFGCHIAGLGSPARQLSKTFPLSCHNPPKSISTHRPLLLVPLWVPLLSPCPSLPQV